MAFLILPLRNIPSFTSIRDLLGRDKGQHARLRAAQERGLANEAQRAADEIGQADRDAYRERAAARFFGFDTVQGDKLDRTRRARKVHVAGHLTGLPVEQNRCVFCTKI